MERLTRGPHALSGAHGGGSPGSTEHDGGGCSREVLHGGAGQPHLNMAANASSWAFSMLPPAAASTPAAAFACVCCQRSLAGEVLLLRQPRKLVTGSSRSFPLNSRSSDIGDAKRCARSRWRKQRWRDLGHRSRA